MRSTDQGDGVYGADEVDEGVQVGIALCEPFFFGFVILREHVRGRKVKGEASHGYHRHIPDPPLRGRGVLLTQCQRNVEASS